MFIFRVKHGSTMQIPNLKKLHYTQISWVGVTASLVTSLNFLYCSQEFLLDQNPRNQYCRNDNNRPTVLLRKTAKVTVLYNICSKRKTLGQSIIPTEFSGTDMICSDAVAEMN